VSDDAVITAGAPVERAVRADLRHGILAAVIYADLFRFPLTHGELHRGVVGEVATRVEVRDAVERDPELRRRLEVTDGFVHLRGHAAHLETRREQARRTDTLVARHRRVLAHLGRIPFLRMLAFSGGTSHRNSTGEGEDLDLFVVTEPGRSWLVYGLIVLLARLHRCRPVICANYVVDLAHLAIPRRDLFTAHELLYVRPVTDPGVRRALLAANGWVFRRYPNATGVPPADVLDGEDPARVRRRLERILAPLWPLAERLMRRVLGSWIRRKAGAAREDDVVLGRGVLKLHLHDHRRPVAERFRTHLLAHGVPRHWADRHAPLATPGSRP